MFTQQTLHTIHTIMKGDLNAQHLVWWRTMQILLGIALSEDTYFLRTPTVQSRSRQAATCDPRRHFALFSRTRAIRFKTGSLNLKKKVISMTSYNHREYVVFRTEYCHWNLCIRSAMTPASSHVLLLRAGKRNAR